ncbi:MAG TPA: hypothetical protein VKV95_04975 [Terriglobia bacterium]|nr:hypothetical protein [Terriglobia bacterium]
MDSIRRMVRLCSGSLPLTIAAVALLVCLGALPAPAFQDEESQGPPPSRATAEPQDAAAPNRAPVVQQDAAPRDVAPHDEAPRDDSQPPSFQPLPPKLTLPAGTLVTVRISQMLSSDQNVIGDTFTAELQQPLVVEGWVVARRGQTIMGRVAVAQKAGRVKGTSQLGVELSSLVLVDGQQLPVRTQLQQDSGGKSVGRDATAIGTTTGVGALIGAAAGEGKGAAIGAGAGALVGIAGVLLTRGRPTIIPPETALTFQLQSPVAFSTERSRPAFRPVTQADYDNGPGLRRRPQGYAAAGPYPPSYWGYNPWGYYPGPVYFGYYGYGYGRGYGRYRAYRH